MVHMPHPPSCQITKDSYRAPGRKKIKRQASLQAELGQRLSGACGLTWGLNWYVANSAVSFLYAFADMWMVNMWPLSMLQLIYDRFLYTCWCLSWYVDGQSIAYFNASAEQVHQCPSLRYLVLADMWMVSLWPISMLQLIYSKLLYTCWCRLWVDGLCGIF